MGILSVCCVKPDSPPRTRLWGIVTVAGACVLLFVFIPGFVRGIQAHRKAQQIIAKLKEKYVPSRSVGCRRVSPLAAAATANLRQTGCVKGDTTRRLLRTKERPSESGLVGSRQPSPARTGHEKRNKIVRYFCASHATICANLPHGPSVPSGIHEMGCEGLAKLR